MKPTKKPLKPAKTPLAYATVPRLLPNGGTVLITGSGPSLTQADVDLARSHVDAMIAVNDSYKLAPDAEVLYAGDAPWWGWHKGCEVAHTLRGVPYPAFTGGTRYCIQKTPQYPGIQMLRRGPQTGLSLDPQMLATGLNSVYAAINLAVHLGATRVLLLGVDMHGGHFFGSHPNNSGPPFALCLQRFSTLVDPLRTLGVEVINCTPKTELKVFPRVSLPEAVGFATEVAS